MKIVVCGLGHVGIVTTACLLKQGHAVVGVDRDRRARDLAARGLSSVDEPGVNELLAAGHSAGRLTIDNGMSGHADADMVMVCVGTPGAPDGALDLSDITAAARALGQAVRTRSPNSSPMLMVFRSTVLPGSMARVVLPAIATAAGEPPGARYDVAYNPEFFRAGTAVADYFAPGRIVIGERVPGVARAFGDLNATIAAPFFATSFEVAEFSKCMDNAFHALKVVFANEMGRYAVSAGIPPADTFAVFLADTKLNLSALYLRPGGAFGGPCLVKDVQALAFHMLHAGVDAPVMRHIVKSNDVHRDFLVTEVERRVARHARLLVVGLGFKPGTSDIRESSLVALAGALLDRGHDLTIYEPRVLAHADLADVALPPRVAAVTVTRIPEAAVWDLVIVGDSNSGLDADVDPAFGRFRLDRA